METPERLDTKDILFPSTSTRPTPRDPQGAPTPEATPTERIRTADLLHNPATTLGRTGGPVRENLARLHDAGLLTPEQQDAELKDVSTLLLEDMRLPLQDAEHLHTLDTHFRVSPPSQEDVDRWGEESRTWLRERYGPAESERVIAHTRTFIEQHPKLKALLSDSPLGNRLDVVRMLIERARRG